MPITRYTKIDRGIIDFDVAQSYGAYSAIMYVEGDAIIIEDHTGRTISRGTNDEEYSSAIQEAVDQIGSGKSIFVMSGDYNSASVTLGENQTMILENGVTNLSVDASASGAKVIRHSGIASHNVVTKTSNYTASNGDCVLADASSEAITITLPSPSNNAIVNVKKIDSSANVVTVEPNGSETIDGSSSKTIDTQYESYTFISDGTNWYII